MPENQFYYQPPQPKDSKPALPNHKIYRRRRILVATIGILVLVLILGVVGVYGYARIKFGQIKKVGVGGLSATISNQPINILLVGNNSRSVLNGKQASAFGTGAQVGGARSDVTMIAHLDPATKRVTLVSLPRDLFLPIPGSTKSNRVDAALNKGPSVLVSTIEQDLGIPIQHYVELNFDTFQSLVNALGGLYMDFPYYVKDAMTGLNITHTGCQYLNGTQALALVRSREMYYSTNGINYLPDGLGDLSRIRRDHEFLRVLAQQVKAKGISNPLKLNSILSSVVPFLKLDSTFTFNGLLGLATTFRNINPSAVATATLPIALENNYQYLGASYGDVVFPAQPQDAAVMNQYLGLSVPKLSHSTISIAVLNGTGQYQQASSIATSLGALGYKVLATGNSPIYGSNLETVVRYAPGYLNQAQVVMASLSGAVVLSQGTTSNGAKINVITGTSLSVAPPQQQAQPSPNSTAANSHPTVTTAPITLPATSSNTPLQPWDPRACTTNAG
ncbi:LCP family protein [Acidithrix ferrooxidans]|uniref:Putative transcriptional regulator YvhJ n=1 Tax=Acidithrix ferrooxidans TaxID=1280514 RepID=A0A0D8HFX1_9ACTN|nr:LCP family protein [Acidithrix ferrooxidans]KJF16789.1 putative transcriptional regulator YvhJ [Acidithrix ferrooxidans]